MEKEKSLALIQVKPPFALETWRDAITSKLEGHLFMTLTNIKIDKQGMYVREGLTRQCDTALMASEPVKAIYKATYLDGTIRYFAYISDTLMYYEDPTWVRLTSDDATINDGSVNKYVEISDVTNGHFRHYKNRTYFTNGEDVVLQIKGTELKVVKAGLPDPNDKQVINNCETIAEWVVSGTGTPTLSVDKGMEHYVQGDGGLLLKQTTATYTATMTRTLAAALDLTEFESGAAATEDDYISFSAFRGVKPSIEEFSIELETTSGNYFRCYIYDNPIGWDFWSPKQESMCGKWANDPDDHKMFLINLRKNWFEEVGSPNWNSITKVRVIVKASNEADTDSPASIILDYIRLQHAAPIAEPLRRTISTCERGEAWTAVTGSLEWVDYWATMGVSCLRLNKNTTAKLANPVGWDLTAYAEGTAMNATDCFTFDVGGPGDIYKVVQVKLVDSSARTAVRSFGLMSFLLGGGLKRQIPLSEGLWTGGGSFTWSDVREVHFINDAWDDIFLDNVRIEPGRRQKIIDPFEAVERRFFDAVDEAVDPIFGGVPWVGAIEEGLWAAAGTVAEWWLDFKYSTFGGDGSMVYPDFSHGARKSVDEGGNDLTPGCCMTLNASGGATFGMHMLRTLVPLDLANHKLLVPVSTYNWDPVNGNYGFLQETNIPMGDEEEFEIWMACPDFRNVRSIEFKFYKAALYPALPLPLPLMTSSKDDYWTYTIDCTAIAQLLQMLDNRRLQYELLKKKKKKYSYKKGTGQTEAEYYLQKTTAQEMNVMTNLDNAQIVYLGTEYGSHGDDSLFKENWDPKKTSSKTGWHRILFRWKLGDMTPSMTPEDSRQHMSAYEITLTAMEGKTASVAFDEWTLKKRGSLKGSYYYKTLLVDEDGFESAPSDASFVCKAASDDVLVSNIYDASEDGRVVSKTILRMSDALPTWAKVKELAPGETSFKDFLPDAKAVPWIERFNYAPPKANIIEIVGNYAFYLDITDRFKRKRPSRLMRSEPFAPHQVNDDFALDIQPEDGDKLTGIVEHLTSIVVTKESSIWTIDVSMNKAPICRMNSVGIIATRSLQSTPYGLIGLSREGMIAGDITKMDPSFGRPIWGTLSGISLSSLRQAVGIYLEDSYYLFVGGVGFGCYLPEKHWYQLAGIVVNSSCFDDNKILYGDATGYVNTMFDGHTDFGVAISSTIQTQDFVGESVRRANILSRLWILAKYLNSAATLTTQPVVDQIAEAARPAITVDAATYAQYVIPFLQGTEGILLGAKITGSGRFAINRMTLETLQRDRRI